MIEVKLKSTLFNPLSILGFLADLGHLGLGLRWRTLHDTPPLLPPFALTLQSAGGVRVENMGSWSLCHLFPDQHPVLLDHWVVGEQCGLAAGSNLVLDLGQESNMLFFVDTLRLLALFIQRTN